MSTHLFHQYPERELAPRQMHYELTMARHKYCSLESCEMVRYCWHRLLDLGHPHPAVTSDDCATCKTEAFA